MLNMSSWRAESGERRAESGERRAESGERKLFLPRRDRPAMLRALVNPTDFATRDWLVEVQP
jgi:hypothetical protein